METSFPTPPTKKGGSASPRWWPDNTLSTFAGSIPEVGFKKHAPQALKRNPAIFHKGDGNPKCVHGH